MRTSRGEHASGSEQRGSSLAGATKIGAHRVIPAFYRYCTATPAFDNTTLCVHDPRLRTKCVNTEDISLPSLARMQIQSTGVQVHPQVNGRF